MFYRYPDSDYNDGVQLEEYRGVWSLALASEGNDGKVYKKWGKIQTGKDKYADKAMPWKISLGDGFQAIECLELMLNALKANMNVGEDVPPKEDIPF